MSEKTEQDADQKTVIIDVVLVREMLIAIRQVAMEFSETETGIDGKWLEANLNKVLHLIPRPKVMVQTTYLEKE